MDPISKGICREIPSVVKSLHLKMAQKMRKNCPIVEEVIRNPHNVVYLML